MTVSETFHLYLQAMADEAESGNNNDESLLPHLGLERLEQIDRVTKIALAFASLTPEEKIDLGKRMYP